MRWHRKLWGVRMHDTEGQMLIGNLWLTAEDGDSHPYAGEPTRALLFCTRQQARTWCARRNAEWRARKDLVVSRWRVLPVRVVETVTPIRGAHMNLAKEQP